MADEREIPKIRTMRGDAEELIKERQVSRLDIATKQYVSQNRAGAVFSAAAGRFLKKAAIYFVILLLLGAGGYFGYQKWLQMREGADAISEAPKPFPKMIAADEQKISAFREALPGELTAKINEERKRLLRFGTIVYLPVKIDQKTGGEKFIDSGEFVKTLSWRSGNVFLENVFPEFNALVAYTDVSRDFSVIFKVRDFARAVGSMLEWERAIAQDFRLFLDGEGPENINQFTFRDEIIKNNDSRVLKNSTSSGGGKTLLAYTIFNKQFLVISTSRDGLALIIDRLIKLPPRN